MISVSELRRASSSLSDMAAHVRRSAERHGTQRSATQPAFTSIEEASRSPDARRLVAQGEVFVRHVAGTDEALGEVERTLCGLADRAGGLATRLSGLERERESLLNSLWRAQASAYSPDTMHAARAELDRVDGELRTIDRRIEGLRSDWEGMCALATSVVARGEQALVSASQAIERRRARHRTLTASRSGLDAYSATGATIQLGRSGVHVRRAVATHRELRHLKGQITTAADYLDERRLPRRTRREMMRKSNRPIQNRLPAARQAHHRAMTDLRKNRPLTQAGRALEGSKKYLKFVRGAGVAGILSSGWGIVEGAREGDRERVATGSVTVVGSALMLVPAAAPVGAVLVAGAMI